MPTTFIETIRTAIRRLGASGAAANAEAAITGRRRAERDLGYVLARVEARAPRRQHRQGTAA